MKSIHTITMAKKDYPAVELTIFETCKTRIVADIGMFKARVTFLCTEEEWTNFESIIKRSGIDIKG